MLRLRSGASASSIPLLPVTGAQTVRSNGEILGSWGHSGEMTLLWADQGSAPREGVMEVLVLRTRVGHRAPVKWKGRVKLQGLVPWACQPDSTRLG